MGRSRAELDSERSKIVAPKRSKLDFNTSGSIRVVLTRQIVRSCQKLLTLCFVGKLPHLSSIRLAPHFSAIMLMTSSRYANAVTCYAYLEDVKDGSQFTASRWFKRGWTLQELIAPPHVLFFDSSWIEIGSRASLRRIIEGVTGIPARVLLKNASRREYCVAQIMSWAAGRETTRAEDRAYSLLGLFGVSMPLIYGEGGAAFRRLQLEILKLTTDHSLFAWLPSTHPFYDLALPLGITPPSFHTGLLASSVDDFSKSGDISQLAVADDSSFEMTNLGLRITLPCFTEIVQKGNRRVLFASLNCKRQNNDNPVGIFLKEMVSTDGVPLGKFHRVFRDRSDLTMTLPNETAELYTNDAKRILLYVVQNVFRFDPVRLNLEHRKCSLDYYDLSIAGYHLDTITTDGTSVQRKNKACITFDLNDLLWPFWPYRTAARIFVFKHLSNSSSASRLWIALSMFQGRIWSIIDNNFGHNELSDNNSKINVPVTTSN